MLSYTEMYADVEEFLSALEGSPEHEFYSAIIDVVRQVDFDPASVAQGFGLLDVISQGELATERVNTLLSPFGGSIEETAWMVAHLFIEVGQPPIWWKAGYPTEIFSDEVQVNVRWWVQRVADLPAVEKIER